VARAALGKPVQRKGAELIWRCPHPTAHEHGDAHPSLKVNPKKDVFMCGPCGAKGKAWALAAFIAGVDPKDKEAVLSWLEKHGLRNAARREAKLKRGPCVAEYPYPDLTGKMCLLKRRFEPGADGKKKDFEWFHDDNGEWKFGYGGHKPGLYRHAGIQDKDSFVETEGEKDADAGADKGFPTCTSGGTGSFNEHHAECLRGKRGVIIADGDEAGRAHAQKVAALLWGKAASLKICEIPGAKDLAEAIEQGWTRERLLALFEKTPEWKPVGDANILDHIRGLLKRFVALSIEQACAVTLWVAHTHAMPAADCTPYLSINSAEKQSGKTRLLEVLRLLVPGAWFTGRVTAAVLVRKIDACAPTLLLDESDAAFKGDETYAETLRGVLNTGYRRGGCVSLCVGQGAAITFSDFSTFCPKAIAGIGKLPDTITDRSIPIRLKRAQRGTVERFRERDEAPKAQELYARIAAWGAEHIEKLRNARPEIPDNLSDRQADVCEPLLAIADAAGGKWPEAARNALQKLCIAAQTDDGSFAVQLLRDIKTKFAEKCLKEVASAELCDELALIETSPWGDCNRGKALTPAGLARRLRPFEIYPGPLSTGRARGYKLSQFEEAFTLYLPVETVKASETQYSRGSEVNFKVSSESPSDTFTNAVSPNNGAGSRHFDTLDAGIGGDQEVNLDETIFTNPAKPTTRKTGYTEGVL
jgi:hypothetical protein